MHLNSLPWTGLSRGLTALLAFSVPVGAYAQSAGSDADSTQISNARPQGVNRDRQMMVGAFTVYAPAYLGADEYQLAAGPLIQLRYDRVSFSFLDGLSYDVIRSGGWRAGPMIGLRQSRRQSGDNPLRIAGDHTDDLQGLGTIDASADVGGYIAYQSGSFGAKIDVRQATDTDLGLIATLSARYTVRIPMSDQPGPPAIISIGPRVSFVDNKYNQTYFGVTAEQSMRSGLPEYSADGGLLSAGVGLNVIVPLNNSLSATVLAGYDRLAEDAARSPLVEERGSRNQATVGFGLVYRFGL